jgi:hypothetical protein
MAVTAGLDTGLGHGEWSESDPSKLAQTARELERDGSNAFARRARIIRYQVDVLGETPSAALAARNRSTA